MSKLGHIGLNSMQGIKIPKTMKISKKKKIKKNSILQMRT